MQNFNKKSKSPRWENHIQVFSHACKFVRFPTYDPRLNPNRSKSRRGHITQFSRHSRLRLREALAKCQLENCQGIFGVCLTLPWKDNSIPIEKILEEYRKVFHRFTVYYRRTFLNSACIFRHEMQVRKIPHCHLVLHLSKLDGIKSKELESIIKALWVRSLNGSLHNGDFSSFLRYGCKVDLLDGSPAVLRYISDHTSKAKQAQLGYIGKQWGYIRKESFTVEKPFIYTFKNDSSRIFFHRHIKKLSYFTLPYDNLRKRNKWSPSKFVKTGLASRFTGIGYKKIRNNSCAGLRFIDKKFVQQICNHLDKNDII